MTTVQTTETTRDGLRPWLFRGLLVIGAGLMLVSWYMPWWGARIGDLILPGNHLAMHPWGVDAIPNVSAVTDRSLYEMPAFFAPLMWLYLGLCIVALLASLLVERTITLGRFKISLPKALIAIVGLSYLAVTVGAIAVAFVRSGNAGANFLGATVVYNPVLGGNSTFTGYLEPGYWLAVATGPVLIALALFRNAIIGKASK